MKTTCSFLPTCVLASMILTTIVQAQEKPPVAEQGKKPEPSTQVEKFVSARGKLIIKDYYKLTTLIGNFGESLKLDLLVFSAPATANKDKVFGVRFEVPRKERFDLTAIGFLDFDEAKDLAETLGFMQKLASEMAEEDHENTEVIYETRGRMQFGFFQVGKQQTAFVKIDAKNVFVTMLLFESIKTALDKGTERLAKLGAK